MKNIIANRIILLIITLASAVFVVSCEYKEVADADYPIQSIYMPAATNGIFTIDNVPQRVEFLPTPGQAYRFTIDLAKNKLIVPLGVYRGGLDRSGSVATDIIVNTDTITKLIANGKIPVTTTLLPALNFSIPGSVVVSDGSELGAFNLEIDLTYLKSFPNAIFGIGVGISSTGATVSKLYNTTIIIIYTKILFPTANFSATIDGTDKSKVTFSNTSAFQMKNDWNFGDGTIDTVKSPVHFFTASNTYTVTLVATGVLGSSNQVTKTTSVVILLLPVTNFTFLAQTGNTKLINFTNTSTKCVSYSWNFGDGSAVSTETSPSHTYTAAGTYTVVLTGKGDTGVIATKSIIVTAI